MADCIKLEDGAHGLRAIVQGVCTSDLARNLVDKQVLELELNSAKGWQPSDLAFLAELPQLRALTIIDFRISSVEPIHFLHELRALKVFTYCKTEINFSAFPRLENCALEWRPKAFSLFDCNTLKKLFVNRYKGKNTESFGKLSNLESLAILNAPIENLYGLSTLVKLQSLRIANLRCLGSLAGIDRLVKLNELKLDTCKRIQSIEEIGHLSRLRWLLLDNLGDIESLKPLAKLTGLEWLIFCESTNIIDGNLTIIVNQPNLSRVAFKNRKHYSHRREDFGAAYSG